MIESLEQLKQVLEDSDSGDRGAEVRSHPLVPDGTCYLIDAGILDQLDASCAPRRLCFMSHTDLERLYR